MIKIKVEIPKEIQKRLFSLSGKIQKELKTVLKNAVFSKNLPALMNDYDKLARKYGLIPLSAHIAVGAP